MSDRRGSMRRSGVAIGVVLLGGAIAAFAITRSDGPGSSPPVEAVLAGADLPEVTVYKSPTCNCCAKWVEHMEGSGFEVTSVDTEDVAAVKAEHGIAADLTSCHTALVGGYVIEGHVPADLIARLLEERPEVLGLAVPGMPMGSPGMEGPRQDTYDVIAFDREGGRRVYASR